MAPWLRRHLLFVLFVALPTLAAVIYYGLIASDVYTSESRFIVRSSQRSPQSGLASLLQGAGSSSSVGDTYAVSDYILSRDALRELDQKLSLRQAFSSEHADVFNRFPRFGFNRSFEDFYRYYGKHVGVDYDPTTSISILTVNAFTADDAYKINSQLLDMSERLVNALNDRTRQDLIRYADNEVKIASEKAKEASLALLTYRSSQSVFEPDRQATIQLQGVAKLQDELISAETDLAQVRKLSPDSPQIEALTSRIETLRAAMAELTSNVTSARGSFSARTPTFDRLTLESEFADKQLGVALDELQTARSEARQKQLYLVRLVQPSLPDKAMQPRRIRSMFTVFMLGLIGWGVARLLIASVLEHAD